MAHTTGRIRYRVQTRFLRKPVCVIQLEWSYRHIDSMGGYISSSKRKKWLDASPEDLSEMMGGLPYGARS